MNNNALSEKELANRLFALQAENDALKLENESLASIINSDQSYKNNLSENNESDLKFKNMVWDMQVGVMIQNIHSEILLSNPKSLELLGISEEQLLGKTSFDPDWNVIHEDGSAFPGDTHPVPQAIATHQSVHNVVMGVYRPSKADRVWLNVDAELQLNNDGSIKQVICTFIDISELKHAENELIKSQEMLKKFAFYLQNKQEEEKVLLATQLDNELGQILIALKMDIGLLMKTISKENTYVDSISLFKMLDNVKNTIGNSIKTTLKLMTDLRFEVLYLMGFVEAVRFYSTEFETKHRIKCNFESEIQKLEIAEYHATSLFRILQIAMSNVAEHSKATEVNIYLCKTDKKISLKIVDNGIGFDEKKSFNPNSNGLIFMKERTLLLNGTVQISSKIDKGVVINIEIPIVS